MIRKAKVLIDMGMTLCLLLCMAYLLIGETLHEFIGTAMILLFITHNVLNAKWYRALFQGRYTPSRSFQAVINLGCLLAMLGLAFSGMVLSRTVFSWVSLPGLLGTARVMHLFCSYWGFVLLSLHLGLHGSMVLGAVKKRREKELPPAGKWLLRSAAAGAAVYGLTAFLRQNIPSYLFLQNQFVFFDTEQPLALFFLDEAAMMTLWAVLAYYLKKALIAAKKHGKIKKEVHDLMKNLKLPKIAMGAWAWGDDGTFGGTHTAESMKPIFDAAMENGLNLWDTAFAYGMGTSEKTLGRFLAGLDRNSYILSDKFTPQCADSGSETPVEDMLKKQYGCLGIDRMDIYWIHNPVEAPHWTEELATYFEGREAVPMLGVSNHNLAEIKQADEILKKHGLRLSAVQNHYSLLNRSSESSGILDYCKENDIVFFSYMVLEQGALSGKYDAKHPMPESDRANIYQPMMDQIEVLNAEMKKVAEKYGVETAQIPVAWAIGKGTLPIIGVTKVKHVEDAAKAAHITLTAEEMAHLEQVADSLSVDVIRYWERVMN